MILKVNSFFLRKAFVLASFCMSSMIIAAEKKYNISYSYVVDRKERGTYSLDVHEAISGKMVAGKTFDCSIQSHSWNETEENSELKIKLSNNTEHTIAIPKN